MTATKTKPETPHQAEPAHRRARKAPEVAPEARAGGSAAERRALIEAAMNAGKGTKLPPGARSRQAQEELEADKRAARQSLLSHVPTGEGEQWGKKYTRAVKTPPRLGARPKTDRDPALKVLAKVGVTDPENDERVQTIVGTAYRNGELLAEYWKSVWADEANMADALKAFQPRTEPWKEKKAYLLSQLQAVQPKPAESGGQVNVAIRSAIGCAEQYGWPWTVAAAAVFLLAADGRSYEKIKTLFKDHEGRRREKFGA